MIHTIAGTRLDHGGTSRSVPALCEAISQQGVDVHFLATRPAEADIPYNIPQPPVVSHFVEESSRFGRLLVGREFRKVLRSIQCRDNGKINRGLNSDLIHDHGVWLASNHAVARFARKSGTIRVVSPRGMLSAWAIDRARWKKRSAWWLYQRSDLQSAAAFHVTSRQEASEVRSLGFRQPVAIIPNGVLFPEQSIQRQRQNGCRRMLFLSRIHPVKGLLELVRAWKSANVQAGWELLIVGPSEGTHQQLVEREVRELGLTERIRFSGPVNDVAKWQAYADADLFVLPSFSENFGIAIAEALAAGLPVITTTGTPWSELLTKECGWWVEPNAEAIAQAIATATKLSPKQLDEMGQIGSKWVRNRYTWDAVATEMIQFYQWLQQDISRPEFVDI